MVKRAAWFLAALLALLALLIRRRPEWTDRDERQARAESAARGEAIGERRKRKEAEARAELEKKRSRPLRDRVADALDRASTRLDRGADGQSG
jgi:hypothetical protein